MNECQKRGHRVIKMICEECGEKVNRATYKEPDKWVSVKDRLPEPDAVILTLGLNGYSWEKKRERKIWIKALDCQYDPPRWLNQCGCSGHDFDEEENEITHWQPLPKPPKDQ